MAEYLEPGTIDKVRNNIGPISDDEAKALAEKLGGKVLQERSTAPVIKNRPKSSSKIIKPSGKTSGSVVSSSSSSSSSYSSDSSVDVSQLSKQLDEDGLPVIDSKELKLMERLMASSEYGIRPNYGVFNFVMLFGNNRQKLTRTFGSFTIKHDVDHLQGFINSIKSINQISPDIYKQKIQTEVETKFKFMRTVGSWSMRDIRVMAVDLESNNELTIPMLIPFIRTVYKMLLVIYYIGADKIPAIIKEVFSDLMQYPDSDKKKLQYLCKQAATEWLYVNKQIIKGLYPLLMRMCSKQFEVYPEFFTSKASDILSFVGLTKYDLIMPDKKKKGGAGPSLPAEAAPEPAREKKVEEKVQKKEERKDGVIVAGDKDEFVRTGLKMLEQLFPDGGFNHLESHPDMFPYFEPIYKFGDGFNMLAPENGLQVTIVLLKIIEEFFQGCRNIQFNIMADEEFSSADEDVSKAMLEWAVYSEDLFNKKLGDYLRTFVNQTYSQPEFVNSQFGKETMTNILWLTKYYFLPYYEFTQLILKKPRNDNPYKSLSSRVFYLRRALAACVKKNTAGDIALVLNPAERYHFDLPNNISRRLDVLLGAKKIENTSATNANLIKYTACIVAVLDWWINNKESPAYNSSGKIYRVSEEDGSPVFSAPERSDQNQLFVDAVKKAVAAKKKS